MKRVFAFLICVAMLFSVAACANSSNETLFENGVTGTSSSNKTTSGTKLSESGATGGSMTANTLSTTEKKENEMTAARKEYLNMIENLAAFPVNFVYNGRYYAGFDGFEEIKRESWSEADREGVDIYLAIDETLTAKLETCFYPNYEAYEYTVYFENVSSDKNSGIIEQLNAVDMQFKGNNAHLKGILGDHGNQYLPYAYDLAKRDVSFSSLDGRATHNYFPYFNLETDDGGALLAIGWGGTWDADFHYDAESQTTHYRGTGTVGFASYLKPGETVRTPLIATVRYYTRDEEAAMNQWRAWMIDCNLPSADASSDTAVQPFTSVMLAYDTGKPNSDGSISESYDTWRRSLEAYYNHGLTADYRWVDAGWYYSPYNSTVVSDWWGTVGTWEVDKIKWPGDTFREATDYAREHGTKTFLWFEPERVTHLDGMVKNYGYNREWVLSDHGNNNVYVNNLGNKDCLEWTLNRIITTMDTLGIDMYREDFNLDPAIFWSIGDGYEGANRTGITENLYMQGHYALWDGILDYCAKAGKCTFLDSCASGGVRNDLETLRRSVPLLRSDSDRTTIELRLAMPTRLVRWIPFTGASSKESGDQLTNGVMDTYVLRASYLPHLGYQAAFYHEEDSIDWDVLIQGMEEWNELKDYFYSDFYVLTPQRSTTEKKEWTAWEYFDAEKDSGVIQAFRLPECEESTYYLNVQGVNPDHYYTVRDIDGINSIDRIKGSALMNGMPVYAENPRTALTIYIEVCD